MNLILQKKQPLKLRSMYRSSNLANLHRKWNAVRKETGYRSQFEADVAEHLKGVEALYEECVIPYSVTINTSYKPDWILPKQCIVLEAKGRFSIDDRNKMLIVKQQNPNLDIRMIFQDPNAKVTKTMTNATWCDKHGFPWCNAKEIPDEWFMHKPDSNSKEAFKKIRK